MITIPIVAIVATVVDGASSNASGNNSEIAIQSMAPAANHSHSGKNGVNCSTKKNAGKAINGCGKLEKILHNAAFHQGNHFDVITVLIANHSGILCKANANAIKIPNATDGANDTPIAIPSAKECIVMIPTISNTFLLSAPDKSPICKFSYFHSILSAITTNNNHPNIPSVVIQVVREIPITTSDKLPKSNCNHSFTNPKLAAIINAAATAFALAIHTFPGRFVNKNGKAPNPVATAVNNPYPKICHILSSYHLKRFLHLYSKTV